MDDWPSQGKLPGLERKAPGFHIFWDHKMVAAIPNHKDKKQC